MKAYGSVARELSFLSALGGFTDTNQEMALLPLNAIDYFMYLNI